MVLEKFIQILGENSTTISQERRLALDKFVSAIQKAIKQQGKAGIKFICTHNSRRSQLAEFLLDILAFENKIELIAESAGTEVTAFNESMVNAINSYGFNIIEYGFQPNPLYIYTRNNQDFYYYSKKYTDEVIPLENPIIVTVCGDAEENCPVIPGTFERLHIGYEDPKKYDGTDKESQAYKDKVLEIGGEMYYVVKQLKESTN